jgi:hypothetical protein
MNASKFCFMVFLCVFGLISISIFQESFAHRTFPCKTSHQSDNSSQFYKIEKATPQGKLYIFTLPKKSREVISIGVAPGLETIASPLWKQLYGTPHPIFIINGGFFDPSFLNKNGKLAEDPRDNQKLMGNDNLKPYFSRIFNRTEFRVYKCNKIANYDSLEYDIVPHNAPIPAGCTLKDALGAGPALLPEVRAQEEAFIDFDEQGRKIRDPIGVNAKNARSALGITENGDVLIMMGAQAPEEGKKGFSLQDMADQMKAHGAVKAMALDGGSSSGFWHQGAAHYGKFNKDGSPVIRPVKSVLMVLP